MSLDKEIENLENEFKIKQDIVHKINQEGSTTKGYLKSEIISINNKSNLKDDDILKIKINKILAEETDGPELSSIEDDKPPEYYTFDQLKEGRCFEFPVENIYCIKVELTMISKHSVKENNESFNELNNNNNDNNNDNNEWVELDLKQIKNEEQLHEFSNLDLSISCKWNFESEVSNEIKKEVEELNQIGAKLRELKKQKKNEENNNNSENDKEDTTQTSKKSSLEDIDDFDDDDDEMEPLQVGNKKDKEDEKKQKKLTKEEKMKLMDDSNEVVVRGWNYYTVGIFKDLGQFLWKNIKSLKTFKGMKRIGFGLKNYVMFFGGVFLFHFYGHNLAL